MKTCASCKNDLIDTAKFCSFCGLEQSDIIENINHDLEFLKKNLEPSFKNISELGKGGMATLYLADQTSLDRKVVVKLLSPQLALNEKFSEDFLKEARIAANLKHPNIVEMVDYGKSENRPYYIMEYGENGSLDKLLKAGNKPSIENSCKIMLDILNALKFASEKNLKVHRDIKPENIIVRESGSVFLSDFGIALMKDQFPESNEIMGTAEYMSPEQCVGQKDIDLRSDIYSCGILFFELITGTLPFRAYDRASVMNMQISQKIPSIESILNNKEIKNFKYENISLESISKLILKATQKDRNLRYSNYTEIINDLKDAVGDFDRRIIGKISKQRKLFLTYAILAFFFLLLFIFAIGTASYSGKFYCMDGNCVNGNGVYRYIHGNYFGEFKEGKPEGRGIFFYNNGDWYRGSFKNGKRHEEGSYIFKDGSRYEGRFKNGSFEDNRNYNSKIRKMDIENTIIGLKKLFSNNNNNDDEKLKGYMRNKDRSYQKIYRSPGTDGWEY